MARSNKNVFVTMGASNHSKDKREEYDFYATDNIAAYLLLEVENLNNVWECACGDGELAKVFKEKGVLGRASDLVDRGYGETGIDFFKCLNKWNGDIATNPPYHAAEEFVAHAMALVPEGRKVCMFLRLLFLESQGRARLFEEFPLKTLYVSRRRITTYKNNDRTLPKGGAVAFAWYVWEKGYTGDPIIKWIN